MLRHIGSAAVVALLLAPASALAHANFDRAEPSPGAVLQQPPVRATIWLTAQVEPQSWVTVVDAFDRKVDAGESTVAGIDGRVLTVPLQPNLADGRYRVVWYAIANEDVHETGGTFEFTVDRSAPRSTRGAAPDRTLQAFLITGSLTVVILVGGVGLRRITGSQP